MTSTSRVVTNYVRVLPGNVRGENHRDSASPDVAFLHVIYTSTGRCYCVILKSVLIKRQSILKSVFIKRRSTSKANYLIHLTVQVMDIMIVIIATGNYQDKVVP